MKDNQNIKQTVVEENLQYDEVSQGQLPSFLRLMMSHFIPMTHAMQTRDCARRSRTNAEAMRPYNVPGRYQVAAKKFMYCRCWMKRRRICAAEAAGIDQYAAEPADTARLMRTRRKYGMTKYVACRL